MVDKDAAAAADSESADQQPGSEPDDVPPADEEPPVLDEPLARDDPLVQLLMRQQEARWGLAGAGAWKGLGWHANAS